MCHAFPSDFLDFSEYQLSAQFNNIYVTLHSSTCFEQHAVIIRRTNCITTASGIVTLHKQPYSMQVESGLQSALHPHTVRLLTEGDDTRGCGDTIGPPKHVEERSVTYILLKNKRIVH